MILGRYPDLRRWFSATPSVLHADGYPVWPGPLNASGSVSNAGVSRLRRGPIFGFNNLVATTAGGHTFTGQPTAGPLVDPSKIPDADPFWPLSITCNNGAADPGVEQDQYAWYLSARSDVARQPSVNYPTSIQPDNSPFLFVAAHPDRVHSGTFQFTFWIPEVTKLFPGLTAPPLDAASLSTLFRHVAIYVTRLSDHAYQWASIVAE